MIQIFAIIFHFLAIVVDAAYADGVWIVFNIFCIIINAIFFTLIEARKGRDEEED